MRSRLPYAAAMLLAVGQAARARGSFDLIYTRLDRAHWQVWAADAQGGHQRRLTTSSWDKRSLRAVPGSHELLLRNNEGRLYRLDLAKPKNEVQLDLGFDTVKDFDFDPAAGWLIAAYAPNAIDNVCIWHLPAAGGQRRLLIPDPYLNETPRWLVNRKGFVFAKGHAGKSWLSLSQLAEPKSEDFVKEGFATASDPAVSPDGRQVAFCGKTKQAVELWICSATGQELRPLQRGNGLQAEPAWSPDGAWIYFSSWGGANFRLARIRPDGNEFGYLSPAGTDCRCPVLVSIN